MKKIIIIVLAISVILGFLFWRFTPGISLLPGSQPKVPVTLTYWGFEEESEIKLVIDLYKQQNPDMTINYVRQSLANYRPRVQTQIREGVGPDVFPLHNSWVRMFAQDLSPAPSEVFSLTEYQKLFYPVVSETLVAQGQILAAPLAIDGLALYINEEILRGVGGNTPKNWQEFIDLATRMTVQDESGIKTAGAALGSVNNVDYWQEIIGMLLLQQPGVDFNNLATAEAAEVFTFYTSFVIDPTKKTWELNLPSSTEMFAAGRLGFYFAPEFKAEELRLANPNLSFKVVPVPQLSGRQVSYATFWAMVVSKTSQNQEEAWKFVKFLTSEQAQKIAPTFYKSWYLASDTQDLGILGINDELNKVFGEAINAILQGSNPDTALQRLNQEVGEVLEKYIK